MTTTKKKRRGRITWARLEVGHRLGEDATSLAMIDAPKTLPIIHEVVPLVRIRCRPCGDPTAVVTGWGVLGPVLAVIPFSLEARVIHQELVDAGHLPRRSVPPRTNVQHVSLQHPEWFDGCDLTIVHGSVRWACLNCKRQLEVGLHRLGKKAEEASTSGHIQTIRAQVLNSG